MNFPPSPKSTPPALANTIVWELRETESKRIKDSAINQALETIRNRIDQFGVAEPLVQRQGLKQIVVQLPGVQGSQAGEGSDQGNRPCSNSRCWMRTTR